MTIILKNLKVVRIHQQAQLQAFFSMCSPEKSRKPIRSDGRTEGRTGRKTVTIGRMDQRTHVQV